MPPKVSCSWYYTTKEALRKRASFKDLYDFLEANQNIWDSRNLEKNILGKEPDWLKEKRKQDESGNSQIERLNMIKQQLILSDCFSLQCETEAHIESDSKAKTLLKKHESRKG